MHIYGFITMITEGGPCILITNADDMFILTPLRPFVIWKWPLPLCRCYAGCFHSNKTTLSRRLGARRRLCEQKRGNQICGLYNFHLVIWAFKLGKLAMSPRLVFGDSQGQAINTSANVMNGPSFNIVIGSLTSLRLLWQSVFGFLHWGA